MSYSGEDAQSLDALGQAYLDAQSRLYSLRNRYSKISTAYPESYQTSYVAENDAREAMADLLTQIREARLETLEAMVDLKAAEHEHASALAHCEEVLVNHLHSELVSLKASLENVGNSLISQRRAALDSKHSLELAKRARDTASMKDVA